MSGRLPVLKAIEVIRALERAGFEVVRSAGNHKILDHRENRTRTVVVPVHAGRDMKPGTLRAIIRQAGLSVEEFKTFL
jgi:predicted RNA binding protein YcfA (HicA-like mRNA interferase family)